MPKRPAANGKKMQGSGSASSAGGSSADQAMRDAVTANVTMLQNSGATDASEIDAKCTKAVKVRVRERILEAHWRRVIVGNRLLAYAVSCKDV